MINIEVGSLTDVQIIDFVASLAAFVGGVVDRHIVSLAVKFFDRRG